MNSSFVISLIADFCKTYFDMFMIILKLINRKGGYNREVRESFPEWLDNVQLQQGNVYSFFPSYPHGPTMDANLNYIQAAPVVPPAVRRVRRMVSLINLVASIVPLSLSFLITIQQYLLY